MNNFAIRPENEADYDFILRINKENVEVSEKYGIIIPSTTLRK